MAAPLTFDDLYRFRWIDHVRLSRDGERVAYQVGWADASSRQNRSRIVVRRLLDPEPIRASGCAVHPWPASCAGSTTSTTGRDTSTAATTTCSWSRRPVATPSS